MTFLCPCGETFEVKVSGDEIPILCKGCSLIHENGRGDAAPCWIDDKNLKVLTYTNETTSRLRSVPLRKSS